MNKKPKRKNLDWHNAGYGQCGCGRWVKIIDGQCAECHDADYQCELEGFYLKEIAEAVRECERIAVQCDRMKHPASAMHTALKIRNRFPEYFKEKK